MISDNQMISGRQASWIFMLDMLAAGLFSLTAAKEQASSLTMLVGSLLTIGLVLIYYKASFCMFDQYEKKTGIRLSPAMPSGLSRQTVSPVLNNSMSPAPAKATG